MDLKKIHQFYENQFTKAIAVSRDDSLIVSTGGNRTVVTFKGLHDAQVITPWSSGEYGYGLGRFSFTESSPKDLSADLIIVRWRIRKSGPYETPGQWGQTSVSRQHSSD